MVSEILYQGAQEFLPPTWNEVLGAALRMHL